MADKKPEPVKPEPRQGFYVATKGDPTAKSFFACDSIEEAVRQFNAGRSDVLPAKQLIIEAGPETV